MLDNRSVVCTFFNLPPQQQPLCKLVEIVAMFPPPLDYLNLAMAAAEEQAVWAPEGGLGLKSEISDLRKKTATACQNFMNIITLTQDFATTSLKLVDLMATSSPQEQVMRQLSTVVSQARANAKQIDKVRKETGTYTHSLGVTEHELQFKWEKHVGSMPDITSGVSDIFLDWTAVMEVCDNMLKEFIEYYMETAKHYSHLQTLAYDPPSKEENNFIREKWFGLSKGLFSMNKVLRKTHRRLEKTPDARRFDRIPPSWRGSPGSLDSESESEDEVPLRSRWRRGREGSVRSTFKSISRSTPGWFTGLKSRFFNGRSAA